MIFLKTDDEIELLRESNLLVGKTLAELAKVIKPGVTTAQLDKVAEEFIRDHGATPTFKGFPNPYLTLNQSASAGYLYLPQSKAFDLLTVLDSFLS